MAERCWFREDAHNCALERGHHGACRTKHAQPLEPVEPSDDQLFKIEVTARADAHGSDDERAQTRLARRALYEAGLAAEAAAHAETRRELTEAQRRTGEELNRALAAELRLEAELERVRGVLRYYKRQLDGIRMMLPPPGEVP